MAKRIKYEGGYDEEDYVKKCMSCRHSYTKKEESDTLFCGCKKECKYEPIKSEVAENE